MDSKANIPEAYLINFDLVDVIKAFKAQHISLPKEFLPSSSGATSDEICKIHNKPIKLLCLNCTMWVCVECHNSHPPDMGHFTITSVDVVRIIQEKYSKEINDLLTTFEDEKYISLKIKEHSDKMKAHLELAEKHGEEVEKMKKLLEKRNSHITEVNSCEMLHKSTLMHLK